MFQLGASPKSVLRKKCLSKINHDHDNGLDLEDAFSRFVNCTNDCFPRRIILAYKWIKYFLTFQTAMKPGLQRSGQALVIFAPTNSNTLVTQISNTFFNLTGWETKLEWLSLRYTYRYVQFYSIISSDLLLMKQREVCEGFWMEWQKFRKLFQIVNHLRFPEKMCQ